jgi:hypothetical protein
MGRKGCRVEFATRIDNKYQKYNKRNVNNAEIWTYVPCSTFELTHERMLRKLKLKAQRRKNLVDSTISNTAARTVKIWRQGTVYEQQCLIPREVL